MTAFLSSWPWNGQDPVPGKVKNQIIFQGMLMLHHPQTVDANPFLQISEAFAQQLARQFGTPLFIMHEQGILQRYREFTQTVQHYYPYSKVAVSYKTNLLHGIMDLLHQQGADAEVVSGIEYTVAKKLRRSNQQIIFNGPMKLESELLEAIHDKAIINCDHEDEINRIEQIGKNLHQQIPIGLRIYFSDNKFNWSRFGFPIELNSAHQPTMELIKRIIKSPYLKLSGLHAHIGTNIRNNDYFSKLGHCLNQFAMELKQHLQIELSWLDVGGGLAGISPRIEENRIEPHPLPDLGAYAQAIIPPLLPYLSLLAQPATLFFEPGRTLFEAFGGLLTQVVGRRTTEHNEPAYIFDAGINTLATSYAYNFPLHVFSTTEPQQKSYLLGPTCNQQDQLHAPLLLPKLQMKDLLLFYGVGSYCMAFSYSFIRLRPGVVLWRRDEQAVWLRKPETLSHLSALEQVSWQM